jgi:hypothetical protein
MQSMDCSMAGYSVLIEVQAYTFQLRQCIHNLGI